MKMTTLATFAMSALMLAIAFSGCVGGQGTYVFGEKPLDQISGKGWIYGSVMYATSGNAVSAASVFVEDTALSTSTDESGNYVIKNVDPGYCRVRITADGFMDAASDIKVDANHGACFNASMDPFEFFVRGTVNADAPTVLIVSPHEDDGEIFAGGAACHHVAKGDRVVEVFVTDGAQGNALWAPPGEELVKTRQGEARNATAIIGINELVFLGFPDGGLVYDKTSFDAIRSMIVKYKPYVIYTAEFVNPYYGHSDHVNTGMLVYDAVESLESREKPAIRFFDYMVKPGGTSNCFVDITNYLLTKARSIFEYKTQTIEQVAALTVLNAVYLENAVLAGKLGLFEGFREAKFAKGDNVVYDFRNVLPPSSTSVAWYKSSENVADGSPPGSGPQIENATEFTPEMYRAIYSPDGIRAEIRGQLWKRVQGFKLSIGENASAISEMYVRWRGYGTPAGPALYIWDFSASAWESVGSLGSGTSDGVIEKVYSSDFLRYIDKNGCLYLSVISSSGGGQFDFRHQGNQIDTDYLKVRLTLEESK